MRAALLYPYYLAHGGDQAVVPSPLAAWSKDTTSANLQWNDPGADNYVLQRATDSEFSDATEVYSGSNTDYADSGLTIATTYYYRVKAQKAGYADSDWVTASVTTIMAMPEFWYEPAGLSRDVDDEYGKTTFFKVDSIKSIINTEGYTLTAGAAEGDLQYVDVTTPYGYITPNSSNYYTASSFYTLGDFTLACRLKYANTLNNSHIIASSAVSTDWIRFNSNEAIRFAVAGTGVTVTFPALTINKWYDLVVKRVGTTFSISFDGGATFPYTGVCSAADFVVDSFFRWAQFRVQRIAGFSGDQPKVLLDQVFGYLRQPVYTESEAIEDANIVVTGVTWSEHSGDYITGTDFSKNVLASYVRDRIVNIGDYCFILGNKKPASPTFSEDFLVIKKRSTGQISDLKLMGIPVEQEDDHNNGTIWKEDNRIKHAEFDNHYDYATPQSLLISEFGNEFDFTSLVRKIQANGVAPFTESNTQYPLTHRFSATKKAFVFHWPTVANFYMPILITEDNNNYFRKEVVVDLGADHWFYVCPVYSPDGKMRVFLNIENKAGGDRQDLYDYIVYIESADGLTWTNVSGDFSQDISDNNPILLADLIASCVVQDASELTGNARLSWAFYDDSDDEIHGICGDGDDTGLQMFYWDGDDWVFEDINAGTKTLVYDMRVGNGDNGPILIRTGPDAYDAYVHEDNSGDWKIIKKSTTDKGATWTDGEDFSSDDTAQHKRMHVNRDALYNDHITIGAARVVSEDNSDIFIKDA